MAVTVANYFSHALAVAKLPSTGFSAEVVRIANDVQSSISKFHFWHWLLTAATNIATVAGTQDYTMAAGDQNKVQEIAEANLLSGSTELPPLLTRSSPILPKSATQAQPYAVGLLSPTQLRFYQVPNAVYTFQWRYYAMPVVFTATTELYQCPEAFHSAILQGNIWKIFQMTDDDRQETQYQRFIAELSELRRTELRTSGRRRL